ncbi:c-type cytochrome [Sinimarinibacterium thermocellulolyticum]|uniref:C-type cytochrome n=1 Tax=Sinimarinibacterium thermocellulolyticum TaxID=3170016 RepID=A0ABV2AC64_9GAMM
MSLRFGSLPLACAVLLVACDRAPSAPQATPAAQSAAQTGAPADPAVVRLYEQTCRACHDPRARTGAPAAGDAQAWAPRLALGMDVLIERTINGYRGMPPLGACMDCSEDDFVALIRYMAGQ